MIFNKESDFEDALTKILFNKSWATEVLMYPTEKDLLENWAKILFNNNKTIDRLNECPLTDGEMQQIMEQITTLRIYRTHSTCRKNRNMLKSFFMIFSEVMLL